MTSRPPEPPESTLTILEGRGAGNVFFLDRRSQTVLGRGATVTLSLADPAVALLHCTVVAEAGGYVVHDLGDPAGTLVNDESVHRHLLRSGDVLKLGSTTLVFNEVGDLPGDVSALPTPSRNG